MGARQTTEKYDYVTLPKMWNPNCSDVRIWCLWSITWPNFSTPTPSDDRKWKLAFFSVFIFKAYLKDVWLCDVLHQLPFPYIFCIWVQMIDYVNPTMGWMHMHFCSQVITNNYESVELGLQMHLSIFWKASHLMSFLGLKIQEWMNWIAIVQVPQRRVYFDQVKD